MDINETLKNFLDADGKLKQLPVKRRMKLVALFFLAGKFSPDRFYTEKEVNAVLNSSCAFADPATLRRELYNNRFIGRKSDGSQYWLENPQPTPEGLGIV